MKYLNILAIMCLGFFIPVGATPPSKPDGDTAPSTTIQPIDANAEIEQLISKLSRSEQQQLHNINDHVIGYHGNLHLSYLLDRSRFWFTMGKIYHKKLFFMEALKDIKAISASRLATGDNTPRFSKDSLEKDIVAVLLDKYELYMAMQIYMALQQYEEVTALYEDYSAKKFVFFIPLGQNLAIRELYESARNKTCSKSFL